MFNDEGGLCARSTHAPIGGRADEAAMAEARQTGRGVCALWVGVSRTGVGDGLPSGDREDAGSVWGKRTNWARGWAMACTARGSAGLDGTGQRGGGGGGTDRGHHGPRGLELTSK